MAKAYLTPEGMRKRCCTCLAELTLDQFYKSNKASDGLNPRCVTCQTAAVKKCLDKKLDQGLPIATDAQKLRILEQRRGRYKANPEKYRERTASYVKANPEKVRESAKKTRGKRVDVMKEYCAQYYLDNHDRLRANIAARIERLGDAMKPVYAAQTMKRYAQQLSGTPAWADRLAIQSFYIEAARITAETGIRHQVDHIVPIMSKKVCGLHVHYNLQILERTANIKKGNRHWPDQP